MIGLRATGLIYRDSTTDRRTVHISTLADGTLIGAGQRSYCHHPETSGWNPQTYGVEQD